MVLVKSTSKSTAVETAQYIAGLAKELRSLAAQSELGFLAYLLSMVEQEADSASAGGESAGEKKPGAARA